MARRSWRVGPDEILETPTGRRIAVLSRDAQFAAVADALVMTDRSGGTITVLPGRESTGVLGEMVTTEILVTWQDRADAKPQREETIAFEPSDPVHVWEPDSEAELAPELLEPEPDVDESGVEDEGAVLQEA